MPKYIIERSMPGAGQMSESEMQSAAAKSCEVIREMGPDIQWVESYVTDDKIYCVYIAENEGLVREHGKKSGFPVNSVSKVTGIIDATTAEGHSAWMRPEKSPDNSLRQ